MHCERARERLGAYRDGELSPDDRRAVAGHIEACKACAEILADDTRIGRSVQQQGRILAPPALAARISGALDRIAADEPVATIGPASRRSFAARSPSMQGIASRLAALAAAVLVTMFATWWLVDTISRTGRTERDVLNAHIRSLLQDAPVQVASSDQHTVRPWFAGRTDFAPAVKDLAADGFALLGGRLDYVADRRVGAVVYKRRLHVINVFMWPSPSTAATAPQVAVRNGYNLLSWSSNGVDHWAVSDLNADELRLLQRLL